MRVERERAKGVSFQGKARRLDDAKKGWGGSNDSIVERERDGCQTRASLRALRDSHFPFSLDSRRAATKTPPSPRDSRRMSEGEGASKGAKSDRGIQIDVLRVVFFSKSPSVVPQSSKEKKLSLTSRRDELLVLLDGPHGPAELLPRGELLAGGRHGFIEVVVLG